MDQTPTLKTDLLKKNPWAEVSQFIETSNREQRRARKMVRGTKEMWAARIALEGAKWEQDNR
jgi:hypothetical protein